MIVESAQGLHCPAGGFWVDPLVPVERAVLTHAHGDHARPGSAAYLCVAECAPLVRRRLGPEARIETLEYGERHRAGDVTLSLHPAGHMRGSAQVRIEGRDGVWVVSGDYKRQPDPTCAPFEPQRCDAFITEATYALPLFRWDAPGSVAREILTRWEKRSGCSPSWRCSPIGPLTCTGPSRTTRRSIAAPASRSCLRGSSARRNLSPANWCSRPSPPGARRG